MREDFRNPTIDASRWLDNIYNETPYISRIPNELYPEARLQNATVSGVLDTRGISLNPFAYTSTQDEGVVKEALARVRDPDYVEQEARAIAAVGTGNFEAAAQLRYELRAKERLVSAMSGAALLEGIAAFPITGVTRVRDARHALDEQINVVNFCPTQIEGIIRTGAVKDAYVAAVAERAEQMQANLQL